jgi:hypothetical protein
MDLGLVSAAGLTTRSEIEIGHAIRECAVECLCAGDTELRAESFIAKLRSEGWTDQDARQVGIGVLQVVAHINGPK